MKAGRDAAREYKRANERLAAMGQLSDETREKYRAEFEAFFVRWPELEGRYF
jgi:hypothetical protein